MRRFGTLVVLCIAIVAAAWWFREPLLNEAFDALVHDGPASKADLAVVFAGDEYGDRLLTAAQLVREGYVPAVLVDGPSGYYGAHECEAAIPFGVAHGYPESYFRHFHGDFKNTADEAHAVIEELRQEKVRKVLVVTSAYHTRRTFRNFAKLNDIEVHMIGAPTRYANHGDWWKDREGRKTIFLEWTKTVATWFGI